MGFDSDEPLRDACWMMLSLRVRAGITERSGEIIEWWARRQKPENLPYAVVVGRKAAVFAYPRYNTEHRLVYEFRSAEFDPASFEEGFIDHRPPHHRQRQRLRATHPNEPPTGAAVEGLDAEARRILGNLPPRVQKGLQAPFLSNKVLLREWHYEGSENQLNVFSVILVGAKHMTLATGTKLVPVGHDDTSAHWSLRCYLAAVSQRRGIF